MPKLPKPKRISLEIAREYIQRICGLENSHSADPEIFDALCNGELYFEGELNRPANYEGVTTPSRAVEHIPPTYWAAWGYEKFKCGGAINQSKIYLPHFPLNPNAPFYCNLTIATADIDTWLLNSTQPTKRRVSAVPEKVYRERIKQALSLGIKYSRDQDRIWAENNSYSIESIDTARKKYAPEEWSQKGRPKTLKQSAEKIAD